MADGKVLDVSMSDKIGQKYKMIIYDRNNGQNQRFRIVQVSPGKYQIIASIQGGNFTVEVPNGSNKNGEQILISQINNQAN